MADENSRDDIQDDHPELSPRSAPKPERAPILIDGEGTDVTLVPIHGQPPHVDTPTETSAEEAGAGPYSAEPEIVADDSALERQGYAPLESELSSAEAEADQPIPASAREPEFAVDPVADPAGDPPYTPPPAGPPRASGFGGAMRALGLVVLVILAALAGAYLGPMLNSDKAGADERFAAVDAALKDETAARKSLEARLAKLESTAVSADALASVAADAKAAKAAAEKTGLAPAAPVVATAPRPEPAPVAPLAPAPAPVASATPKPEPSPVASLAPSPAPVASATPKPEPSPAAAPQPDPEIARLASKAGVLTDRLDKLEASLATQKSEARADPLAREKALDPVAEAVAAISLAQRLAGGEPYAAEFAALSKSGADAGALAALQPYADTGAPTAKTLGVAFAKIAPIASQPSKAEGNGPVVDDMMDKIRGLVKIHAVTETPGEDPAALTSQISASLARGDVAAALALEGRLPEPARVASAAWVKDAVGLQKAAAAARTLAETALRRFTDAKS